MRDWRGEGSVSWLCSCSTNKWLSLGSNQMQYEGKQSILLIDLLSLLLVLQIVKEIKLKDRDCIPLLDQGAAGQSLASSFHFITIKNNQIKIFFRRHLLIFALAAPVMAIVTFLLLTLHGRENLDTFSATGTIGKTEKYFGLSKHSFLFSEEDDPVSYST